MKQIIKGKEPQSFVDWKMSKQYEESKNNPPRVRSIYARFKKTKKVKTPVKNSLMAEQGYICCYCECRIGADNSHIEHLIPRDSEFQKSLDYDNLLCCCQKDLGEKDLGEKDLEVKHLKVNKHCGHSKLKNILPISPLNPDCETRFIFDDYGQILPAQEDDDEAKKTIEILQLNVPKLKALRKSVIDPFRNLYLDPDQDQEELRTFISDYLEKNSEGEYGECWTTIKCLFGDFLH
ncbi:retron system putative HNH endonuclease [Planktothrix sp. FACHB-1365]|uniref:retron system putative HNH endonuclease n=1 Tax=Planktothrix sp. FACHB-1365 TaxID=2692855 RepID=UPI0016890BE8|nr:retron system putative HNH endonuclease [Planktothrix sp. FACHB-1365]MBD2484776.1 TIGR02646 family protein [Planktothrix sp. FACHB-1365]